MYLSFCSHLVTCVWSLHDLSLMAVTAAGPSGLCIQHIDASEVALQTPILQSLSLTFLLLPEVSIFLAGGSLTALNKSKPVGVIASMAPLRLPAFGTGGSVGWYSWYYSRWFWTSWCQKSPPMESVLTCVKGLMYKVTGHWTKDLPSLNTQNYLI